MGRLSPPTITSAPNKARDTTRKTDITTVRTVLEEYFVNNNVYPAALTDLQTGSAPIIKTLPADPKGSPWPAYLYTPANTNSTYTLDACLENDQDNGANVTATNMTNCTTKTFELTNGN
mgnify:CR=1 FL=1